jgi:putative heme degradation protein
MNGPAFQQLHVTDEAKARAIEALVANWRTPLRLRIFAFVQSTADDSGIPTVQAVVTRVQLLDPHGQVLLETAAP